MALILNPATGLVNPQFHVRFDPEFTNATDLKIKSRWQYIVGFIRGNTNPNRDSRQKRHNQITPELPSHQKPQSVPNIVQPRQEVEEVNINTIPLSPPYKVLPPSSQILEANQEDISQPEGGTGQQTKRAMSEDNRSTSSPRRSKRVTKPVDCLMMEMETVFLTMVQENQTRNRK